MPFNFIEGEVLLLNKPDEWTSFDVVNKIRNLIKHHLGIKKIKIGHAGTLDPLATGLLILCTGFFTKKIDSFRDLEKEYTGAMILGATRPSADMETKIDSTSDISGITNEQIKTVVNKFTGNIKQAPPLYSAKKIEGERAYEFARKGIFMEMEEKDVCIREFEITGINLPEVTFRVVCSKGTYIRSLVRDFGKELGVGAYLSSLCRTRIGEFSLKHAHSIEQIEELILQQKG